MALNPAASFPVRVETADAICALSYEPLQTQEIISSVQSDEAGATAVFIGTTRNSFKGKRVTRLDYQAYSKVAIKTISSIVADAIAPVSRCAVHHRLGTVPVGEASIVIAVSSPHRKEALVACERILEEVKKKAQIWKKEYYEGEDESEAEWKANT